MTWKSRWKNNKPKLLLSRTTNHQRSRRASLKSEDHLTYKPLMSWPRNRSRKSSCKVIQHPQSTKSLIPLSLQRSRSVSSRKSSQLQHLTTTPEWAIQFNMSSIFGARCWSTPAMIQSCALLSFPAWKVWWSHTCVACFYIICVTLLYFYLNKTLPLMYFHV